MPAALPNPLNPTRRAARLAALAADWDAAESVDSAAELDVVDRQELIRILSGPGEALGETG